jgi:hypothetical protein
VWGCSWSTERRSPVAAPVLAAPILLADDGEGADAGATFSFDAEVVSNSSPSKLKACCPCNDWSCDVDGMNPRISEELSKLFQGIDSNNDGKLKFTEFKKKLGMARLAKTQMTAFDLNHDGSVDLDEWLEYFHQKHMKGGHYEGPGGLLYDAKNVYE